MGGVEALETTKKHLVRNPRKGMLPFNAGDHGPHRLQSTNPSLRSRLLQSTKHGVEAKVTGMLFLPAMAQTMQEVRKTSSIPMRSRAPELAGSTAQLVELEIANKNEGNGSFASNSKTNGHEP